MKKTIVILIAILIGCGTNCLAQGKITRQNKVSNTNGPKSGYENGHEWIDLGLPSGTKWATCNISGTSPFDTGDYFYRGESEPAKEIFKNRGMTFELAKDKNVNHPRKKWGGRWRLPTKDEITELCNYCKIDKVEKGGLVGAKLTGPNGNSIILRMADSTIWDYDWTNDYNPVSYAPASYWTSSFLGGSPVMLQIRGFEKDSYRGHCRASFRSAMPIRPVLK